MDFHFSVSFLKINSSTFMDDRHHKFNYHKSIEHRMHLPVHIISVKLI